MKSATYSTSHLGTKIAVYRVTSYRSFVSKFRNQVSADHWIARQSAEDTETRLAKLAVYLAIRANRPAPVAAVTTQLSMF